MLLQAMAIAIACSVAYPNVGFSRCKGEQMTFIG